MLLSCAAGGSRSCREAWLGTSPQTQHPVSVQEMASAVEQYQADNILG